MTQAMISVGKHGDPASLEQRIAKLLNEDFLKGERQALPAQEIIAALMTIAGQILGQIPDADLRRRFHQHAERCLSEEMAKQARAKIEVAGHG